MRLVVAGDANKVVARKLDLSIKTIEKHRSNLMKKLRVRSVPELVRFALLIENVDRPVAGLLDAARGPQNSVGLSRNEFFAAAR